MKRRIHLIGMLFCLLLYTSAGLLANSFWETNYKSNVSLSTYRTQWLIAIISILVLGLSGVFVVGTGFVILSNLSDAPTVYRKHNIILGILYLFGGIGFAPFLSLYLFFKE